MAWLKKAGLICGDSKFLVVGMLAAMAHAAKCDEVFAIAICWHMVDVMHGERINCPMSAIAFVFFKYLVRL